MKLSAERLGETEYLVRAYENTVPFRLITDRIVFHLIFHVADDYCNPPGYSWAAILGSPWEALREVARASKSETGSIPPFALGKLLDSEKTFLQATQAVIVRAGATAVEVRYFSSLKEAKKTWAEIKNAAQSRADT